MIDKEARELRRREQKEGADRGTSMTSKTVAMLLAGAQAFCEGFFTDCNHVHHHSGIGWHTPASVHQGTYLDIDEHRQATLNRAFAEHPERFTRRPRPPQISAEVWINEPLKETPASPPITETVEKPSVSLDLTNSEPRALLSCREPCPWQRRGSGELPSWRAPWRRSPRWHCAWSGPRARCPPEPSRHA